MSATAPTTDLERSYSRLAAEVRDAWDLEQVRTIRNTVGKDLSPAEFEMGMAIAARYQLDPLLREIWFAKGKTRDGRPGRLMIMVGRDGLLRNAQRAADYAGFDCDVVRAEDDFKVNRLPNGERQISHSYTGGADARGAIIGAWAQVYRMGKPSTYFFAPWDEYFPGNVPYDSPWKRQGSVMIQKCALSLALRLAFNLSGVVGEDEGAAAWEEMSGGNATTTKAEELAELFPDELRERFVSAFAEAARLRPGQLSPAAVQLSVTGVEPDRLAAYVSQLEHDNEAAREATAPPEAEVVPDGAQDLSGDDDRPVSASSGGAGTIDGELTADAVEESPVVAAQERGALWGADQDTELLRQRFSDLLDKVDSTELDEAEADNVREELDYLEAELRERGVELP